MARIETQLRSFIVENFLFGQEDTPFSDADSFLDKGLIDSTGVLELVAFLQQQFAITIEDDEITPDNLDSIREITGFLQKKLGVRV